LALSIDARGVHKYRIPVLKGQRRGGNLTGAPLQVQADYSRLRCFRGNTIICSHDDVIRSTSVELPLSTCSPNYIPSSAMTAWDLRKEHKDIFYDYYKHLPDEFLPLDVMEGPSVRRSYPLCRNDIGPTRRLAQGIPAEEWTREAWMKHLCATFPRNHIPPKLALKSGVSFQPPRFLFGWAMEYTDALAIAQGCIAPNERLSSPTYIELSQTFTSIVRERFPLIMDQLGCIVVDYVWAPGDEAFTLIALSDSWITGNRKPTPEQIAALRDFLGIRKEDVASLAESEPMWWVAVCSPQWHYRHRRDDLKEYRPWDLKRRVSS
jgi:hypothetical protein